MIKPQRAPLRGATAYQGGLWYVPGAAREGGDGRSVVSLSNDFIAPERGALEATPASSSRRLSPAARSLPAAPAIVVCLRETTWPWPPGNHILRDRSAHHHLATLNIKEFDWAACELLPPMPALKMLTICLASCADYRTGLAGMGSVWSADLTARGVTCPAIRELHLVSLPFRPCDPRRFTPENGVFTCCCAAGCTLELVTVEEFIRAALPHVSSHTQLPRLVLSGIRSIVDTDIGAALISLKSIVNIIDFQSSPPKHLEDIAD